MAKRKRVEVRLERPKDKFRIGEKVTLAIDWGSGLHRNRRFQITSFQMNGSVKHARGFWVGKYAKKLEEEYGNIFPVLDLKKLDK